MKDIDEISGDALDIAVRLHRELGPGLLESVYETMLAIKLQELGYAVDRQRPIDIVSKGSPFLRRFVSIS